MTRQVQHEKFFHINRRPPYSTHALLSLGQRFSVGQQENPFFGFFRTNVRTYPVRKVDGSTEHVSALRFLRNVKEGNINPDNLPSVAFEIAQHFMMFARELLWELVRVSEFPDAPSRQRGIWLISTETDLNYWRGRLEPRQDWEQQIVEVVAHGKAHECDASLLLADSESFDDSYRKAREYWSGKLAQKGCEPEILFAGELEVTKILS